MKKNNYFNTIGSLLKKFPSIKNVYREPKQYINLHPEEYYTQRNNEDNPLYACMPTSRAMFYIGNKFNLSHLNLNGESLDDYLMGLLNSREAKNYAKNNMPSLYESTGGWPNEIHDMYPNWLDVKLFGERKSKFLYKKASWNDYVRWVKEGKVIMTSGYMPGVGGHAFTIIGFDEYDNTLLLADPYGNYHLKYQGDLGKKGYLVKMNGEDFNNYVHGDVNGKFAHIPLN